MFRVSDAWHAFAVENGRAAEREVKVGRRDPDEVEVLGGLDAGARVVRSPPSDLAAGVRLRERPGRQGV